MRLGYKDMTFCPFHEDCLQGKVCPRAFTKDILEQAEMHKMGVVVYRDPPHCLEPKKGSALDKLDDRYADYLDEKYGG